MEILKNIDQQILLSIHEYTKNSLFDTIMPFITHIGESGIIWLIISFMLLFTKKYRYVGFLTLFSIGIYAVIGEFALKNIIQRPRPFLDINTISLLIDPPTSYSFPSGHTAASFAALGVLASQLKNYRIIIIALAILIAFSRLYLLVHYPFDVFAGIIFGLLCAKVTLTIFEERVPVL